MAETQTVSPTVRGKLDMTALKGPLPEVVVYLHENLKGWEYRTNLAISHIGPYNDTISSVVVVSGKWRFYEHANFGGRHFDLSPGYYPSVAAATGNPPWNDRITSFEPISP
jgi:hypothetical protein